MEQHSSILDKIVMKDMRFHARHGVLEEEKVLGQQFIISLELFSPLFKAGETDCLEHTINYASVYADVKDIVENRQFQLIEALAEAIAQSTLDKFDKVETIKVEIQKPQAPIRGIFSYMGVEIIRNRKHTDGR
jgi:dihydroneopterin aldolase